MSELYKRPVPHVRTKEQTDLLNYLLMLETLHKIAKMDRDGWCGSLAEAVINKVEQS